MLRKIEIAACGLSRCLEWFPERTNVKDYAGEDLASHSAEATRGAPQAWKEGVKLKKALVKESPSSEK